MFEMTQVTKAYRTDLLETHALREFSLKVDKGEFVAVTGPSGSGKTTFLNVAGLLETFDSGSYRLDGVDVSKLDDDARSRVRNHKIGFIFQSFNLIPDLNVFDNVDVPLRYRRMPAAERRERINSALDLVGLSSRMKHLPSQLSGGQQQRVAIARALAGDPALLLADEPTGNLDSLMARQVMDLLEQINGMGATIDGHARPGAGAPRAPQRAGHRRADHRLQAVRGALGVHHGAAPARRRSDLRLIPARRHSTCFPTTCAWRSTA
jgi:putative ABC transport system ATP-binding protein